MATIQIDVNANAPGLGTELGVTTSDPGPEIGTAGIRVVVDAGLSEVEVVTMLTKVAWYLAEGSRWTDLGGAQQ